MYARLWGAVHTVSVKKHEFRKGAALHIASQYNWTSGKTRPMATDLLGIQQADYPLPFFQGVI
jgi:hypothetical protein